MVTVQSTLTLVLTPIFLVLLYILLILTTMATDCCSACYKQINRNSKFLHCSYCNGTMHLKCSPLCLNDYVSCNNYICIACSRSIFPFNYLTDDIEFHHLLLNFFNDLPLFNSFNVDGPRLSILNNFDLVDDRNVDADLNYYNQFDIDSKYYLAPDIKSLPELQSPSNHFVILHLNARSLLNKLAHLEILMNALTINIDVIAITETWETNYNEHLLHLPGYNKYSKPRGDEVKGGGVALFIKNTIEYSPINIETQTFESIFIAINDLYKKPTIIGTIYRPPGGNLSNFNNEFESTITKIIGKHKNIIVAGDFNINLLNHNVHLETETFLNSLFGLKLIPMIKRPTRYGDTCATLIDNFFTNMDLDTQLLKSGIILDDISDHLPIFLATKTQSPTFKFHITKTSRIINDKAISGLSTKLSAIDWSILENQQPDMAYDSFNKIFSNVYNSQLPVATKKYTVRHHKRKPWITTSILNSVIRKQKLYKRYLQTKSQDNKNRYIKYKNKLTKIIRAAERKYYLDKFNNVKESIKDTWKLINNVLRDNVQSNTRSKITEVKDNNFSLTEPSEIANKFNEYFCNIGPNLAKKIPLVPDKTIKDTLPERNKHSMFITPCTSVEIIDIVKAFKTTKGIGLDGFSVYVIKQIIYQIADPLAVIFNKSLESGTVPRILKSAKVTPIFKAEDKKLVNNYRPISVLPVFSKILEKLMFSRLESFINKHNILYKNQFGFREKHSTSMALLNIIEHITSELDNNSYTLGIFIDLSKAFDTIDHKLLLYKLEHYGIRGIALEWFKNYLSDRTQTVEIDDSQSSIMPVTCGVPQGSILGPLLFLLYINDIVNSSLIFKFILFADDTNLLLSNENIDELIKTANSEIQKISDWLKVNKLSLNIKKTHFMLFHYRQKYIPNNICLKIDNQLVEKVSYTQFLGIVLHENLTWQTHILTIERKISKNMGILKALQIKVPRNVLYHLYNTLIYPYLQYCNIAWASQESVHTKRLFVLQKKAIRIVCHAKWNAPSSPLFKQLHTLKFHDINKLQTGCLMYKLMNGILPDLFNFNFTLNNQVHNYNTRQSKNIHEVGCKCSTRKNTIRYIGTSLWNSLPPLLKTKPSISCFRATYKNILQSTYS